MMTTEVEKDNTMTFTQVEGLQKTYAHYLLFKEDSPTLNAVIEKLGLQDKTSSDGKKLYITLLGVRNKEHIAAALSVFGFINSGGKMNGFDISKYTEMNNYKGGFFKNKYEKEMQENAANVNLIHELVINYYPVDGALSAESKSVYGEKNTELNERYFNTAQDILTKARTNLRTSLKDGYYQGSELIDKVVADQPKDMGELGTAIKGKKDNLIEKATKHYEQHTNLDRNLSAVASLYADAHLVGVEQALQVVATAHTNKSGAVTSGVASCKSNQTESNYEIEIVGSELKIKVSDYGMHITTSDGESRYNRCFLLALAHALDEDVCNFYEKIIDIVDLISNESEVFKEFKEDIKGNKYIDLVDFFRYININQVNQRGLICLKTNNNVEIDIKNTNANDGAAAYRTMLTSAGFDSNEIEDIIKQQYKSSLPNEKYLIPIIGNTTLTENTILLVNTGAHFVLGTMTTDICNELIKQLNYNSSVSQGVSYYVPKDDSAGGVKYDYVGGHQKYKTKKRGGRSYRGRSYRKTHRRK